MKRRNRTSNITVILFLILLIISMVSLFIGVVDIDIESLIKNENNEFQVFLLSRIPRLLAILFTGIGMSVAGLIMQQICMNKFVSPTTGATISSAQFGILLSLVFMPTMGIWGRTLFSFSMSILGTFLFVFCVQKIKFKDTILIPLVGIMFGYIISGITNFLAYKFDVTQQLSSFLVGSFTLITKGNYELVYLVGPLVIFAFIYANHFNIAGMGKDFSKNLGLNYKLILFMGLTISAMITASIVTVVGSISYIGLIIPNIVAMFKGDKIRGTLIDTALFGAIFVLVADIIARTLIMPFEVPIELIIGVVGSALFIFMLIYKLKNGRKAITFNKKEVSANEK